jgi:hypothetical protein
MGHVDILVNAAPSRAAMPPAALAEVKASSWTTRSISR